LPANKAKNLEAAAAAVSRLQDIAYNDPITGIPNSCDETYPLRVFSNKTETGNGMPDSFEDRIIKETERIFSKSAKPKVLT
jgi:hypothetical protein